MFKSVGYTDDNYPHKYVYEIHGNLGDIYKVQGSSGLLGKLVIDIKKKDFIVVSTSYLLNLEKIAEPIKLLVESVGST